MTDHVRGTGERELLEYLDFQCPYCRTASGAIKAVVSGDLAGKVTLRARHFPIREKHPRADATARAAEAAGRQGGFWAMHDLLYENFDAVTDEDLRGYAASLGLDIARFSADVEDPVLIAAIEDDRDAGLAAGVTSTPGLLIDGVKYTGFYDREALLDALW
jgi:protein-disulfide isomerase